MNKHAGHRFDVRTLPLDGSAGNTAELSEWGKAMAVARDESRRHGIALARNHECTSIYVYGKCRMRVTQEYRGIQ